jgi:hypothetical protein
VGAKIAIAPTNFFAGGRRLETATLIAQQVLRGGGPHKTFDAPVPL